MSSSFHPLDLKPGDLVRVFTCLEYSEPPFCRPSLNSERVGLILAVRNLGVRSVPLSYRKVAENEELIFFDFLEGTNVFRDMRSPVLFVERAARDLA